MFQPGMKLPVGLTTGGGATFVLAIIMGWWGFPKFLNTQIASSKGLKGGSEIRQMWQAFPEPVDFKIYLFNVTNPQQVHEGAKPIVQEIGPYFYGEFKTKENLKDNTTGDTVTYSQRIRWVFFPEKSGGLTGDELVTIPHPFIVGMGDAVSRTKPGMLGMINKAIPHIYRQPETAFLTAKARDILFDGVLVNCSVTDFSAKAVCGALRKEGKDFHMVDDVSFTFSFFGHKNNTLDPGRMTVNRGIQDVSKLGRVVSWKDQKKLTVWSGDPCNDISGTDSTIFPPFIRKEDGIVAFAPDLCRSIGAVYEEDIVYKGVPGYRFTADLGDQSANPEDKCFCPTEDTCMKKGAMDLFPCAGSPVVVSLPHFYLAHPDYLNSVVGLNPTAEDHEIMMHFEPITGTPLEARKRLQFNMPLHPIQKITLLANVPTALVPLFWVEEGLSLDQKFIDVLQASLFRALKVMGVMKWIMMAAGGGMASAGGFLLYRKKQELAISNPPRQSTKVTSVATVSEDSNGGTRF